MKQPPRFRRGGFTLIEMIITLSIFLLLAAAVFGIFGATMRGASTLQDDNDRGDQSDALAGWLKKNFLALPADGSVVSYLREGIPFDVSDVVWGTPGQFNALDLQVQLDGRYTLRLALSSPGTVDLAEFGRAVLRDDASLSWRPLVHDLTHADWRFRPQGFSTWADSSTGGRPDLVQFSFQAAGSGRTVTDDCWIPRLASPTAPALTAPAIVTSNP